MSAKKWVQLNLIVVFVVMLVVGTFNYIVDPYGLNRLVSIDRFNSKKFSNTYLTTRFQANALERGEYDTLLLGSSRVGVMDPNIVDKYVGGRAFNVGQPRSRADVHYYTLLYADKYNDIKNVIYGIGFLSFNKNNRATEDWEELKEKIKAKDRILNLDLYFNYETLVKNIKLVKNNILGKKVDKNRTPARYIPSNGMRKHVLYIEELQNGTLDLDKEIKNHLKEYFSEKYASIYKDYTFSDEYLDYFKKTVQYCKDKNIKLWVYMSPMLATHFDAISAAGYFDEYEYYERNIVEITQFIDFTGHNTISNNKNNYWDSSHLREEKTEVVMAKIFHDTSVKIPNDFGVLVTRENIEEHINQLKQEIRPFDINSILNKTK